MLVYKQCPSLSIHIYIVCVGALVYIFLNQMKEAEKGVNLEDENNREEFGRLCQLQKEKQNINKIIIFITEMGSLVIR